ncbi:MAG: Ig-like domain-containing protein [candidate division KSB1 bacterium]|nr:Ig-like domain-containing protein [candidate division KSB1 bacterium]MDZ7301903.1 Ig-like domain-containing protein [candidate division KSB1 bacterium]MDZ7310286.1 Ig-like domain-containing protein [candidate division KSB1 bacterium]
MKNLMSITKLLKTFKKMIIAGLAVILNQILLVAFASEAFAQETGCWDDRFGAYNFDYPDYENIFSASVNAIALSDTNDIFIGGSALYFNRNWRDVLKWNGNGWSPLGRGAMSAVHALQVVNNDLYVGGVFTKVDSIIPANRIAKYNLVTQSWSALETDGLNGINHEVDGYWHRVYALAVYENNLYVGGSFTKAGAVNAKNIVQWDIVTQTWTSLGEGVNGTVYAIVVKNGEVYIGGEFSSAGGVPANNIAKWNGREWSALGNGVNGAVRALTICGEDLYVGGHFTKAGEANVRNIAKWNTISQIWTTVGDGVDGVVYALASDRRVVYVGGSFRYTGDAWGGGSLIAANNITKWNPVKSCWSRLGGSGRGNIADGVNGPVYSILIRGNDVPVGGNFTHAGGKPSQVFAIWHEPASPSPHAPTWSNVPDVSFPEDDSTTVELDEFVTDVEHDLRGLNFEAKAVKFNGAKSNGLDNLQIRLKKVSMGPRGFHEHATFTSVKDANGRYTVVFTVTDLCGASASDTIQVTVTPVNDPPVIASMPELTFNEDDSLLYPIRNWFAYVTDPDDADSTLTFRFLSGKSIKAARRGSSHLFTAPPNWYGTNTLKLIVTDRGQLADTAAFVVKVNAINDAPKIAGLPDSLSFRNDGSIELKIWDFVEDVETQNSQLSYHFAASNDSLQRNFNPTTGMLRLTAPHFSGLVHLFITASDGKATARDTIAVRVELTTGVVSTEEQIPTEFVLFQNYPNPFNPMTVIRFGLPHETAVKIEVVNLSGQRVSTLLNERKPAGYHVVEFDARHLASGVYFYRLTAGKFTAMKKLMLVQ